MTVLDIPRITVVGGGSWATALIKVLTEKDVRIHWWLRSKERIDYIKAYGHNPDYLSDVSINLKKVKLFSQLAKSTDDVSYILLAIPAAFLEETLKPLSSEHFRGKTVISAIKGMIPYEQVTVSEYIERNFGVPESDICVIAGPSHAEEVAMEKQTYLTVACKDGHQGYSVANILANRYLKTSVINDVLGAEYFAVMKNIVSLASGIAHGLNYGDNFQAVLVACAVQEIRNFLVRAVPGSRDLFASAYLGDLLVTAYSQFSRNRIFGNMIGRGYTVKAARIEMNMVAEGYYAVKNIHELNRKFLVDMPVTEAVYRILYEKASPAVEMQILKNLMR